ncbi:MAG: hypothetical protein KJP07_01415 [Desulfatitalea sp.]|nr:hypothetical protein [Desulfatitalea sp.]
MADKSKKTFYFYFKENMVALGLPAPESLFGKLTTAVASIGTMSSYVKTYGTTATVAEMLGALPGAAPAAGGGAAGVAAVVSEITFTFGALAASFYVGACIGSLAVATGKSLSGGLSIADLFACAKSHGIPTSPELQKALIAYPEICNADLRGAARIAVRKAQLAKMAVA